MLISTFAVGTGREYWVSRAVSAIKEKTIYYTTGHVSQSAVIMHLTPWIRKFTDLSNFLSWHLPALARFLPPFNCLIRQFCAKFKFTIRLASNLNHDFFKSWVDFIPWRYYPSYILASSQRILTLYKLFKANKCDWMWYSCYQVRETFKITVVSMCYVFCVGEVILHNYLNLTV